MVDFIGPPILPDYSDPGMAPIAPYVPASGGASGKMKTFAEEDGPSFKDLIDIINPLQHIPLVNTLYQHLTGDKESATADLIGGALYGGVVGLGAAIVNLIIEDKTGKNASDNVMAWMGIDDPSPTAVAADQPPTPAKAGTAEPARADQATPVAQAKAAAGAAAGPAAALAPAGNYMVFGGSGPAATSTPAAPDSQEPLVLFQTADAAQAKAAAEPPAGQTPAEAPAVQADPLPIFAGPVSTSLPRTSTPTVKPAADGAAASARPGLAAPAREFPVPQRRAITPRQSLPLPTTGRAAVPGAQTTNEQTQESGSWFVGAFNQAMDKYQRASRLSTPGAEEAAPAN